MKQILFLGFLLLGCNSKQSSKEESFVNLINQLPALETPLIFNSAEGINATNSKDSNVDLKEKINTLVPGFNAYGKIYESENYTAIIQIVPADIAIPILLTYNKQGKRTERVPGN